LAFPAAFSALPHAREREQLVVQEVAGLVSCVYATKFCELSNETTLQRNAFLILYYFV
jgi:hypothetical protein